LAFRPALPQDALQILEEAFPVQVLEVNFNLIDHRALEIGLFDGSLPTR
jgi:hypothetical protein